MCAALRLFRERGYEGTSIADLQEALGIAAPSLYAAFGSKEALFKEAVERYRCDVEAAMTRAVSQARTTKATIEAMLRANAVAVTEPGEPRGCLFVQGALAASPSNGVVERYLHAKRLDGQRNMTKVLKAGVASGDVPASVDIAAVASFYIAFALGLTIQARDGASRASLMAAVDCAMAAWDSLVRP